MSQPRFWRVVFTPEGRVAEVTPVRFGDGEKDWTLVEAPSIEAARKKAQRLYDARKKKLAKSRLHGSGRCACGRDQDRLHPDGRRMLTCSTCSERTKGYQATYRDRTRRGVVGEEPRDEAARVASNLARQRDRRAEIRLETLIEARQQWLSCTNVRRYFVWLQTEIETLTNKGKAA